MARFADRIFLISGGARGLGAAQARRLDQGNTDLLYPKRPENRDLRGSFKKIFSSFPRSAWERPASRRSCVAGRLPRENVGDQAQL